LYAPSKKKAHFILSEIRSDALSDFFPKALEATSFSGFQSDSSVPASELKLRHKDYETYLELGGLPGVCFVREVQTRVRVMQIYFEPTQIRTQIRSSLNLTNNPTE
jgi:hypothetical protein